MSIVKYTNKAKNKPFLSLIMSEFHSKAEQTNATKKFSCIRHDSPEQVYEPMQTAFAVQE